MGLYPRALPSVTQSSALQAPERQRESCNLTTHPHRTDVSHSTLLSGEQHHHNLLHIALCCLEGSTPEDREGLSLFIALRWMQDREGVMM